MAWTDYLPSWAFIEDRGDGVVRVAYEADVVYPKMLEAMEKAKPSLAGIVDTPTQEALTLARHIASRHLKKIMYDKGGKPPMYLHIIDKSRTWALKNFPSTGVPIDKRDIYKNLGIYVIRPGTGEHISLD